MCVCVGGGGGGYNNFVFVVLRTDKNIILF